MKRFVLNDSFFASLDSSVLDVNEAQTLPPEIYVEEEFFEFEKEAIFSHEWLCVARDSWIPKPGDFYTTTHIGEPIVVVRNRDGVVKAMSSVCQHRGMLVAEGHGNASELICQYHHWTYSLDGDLIGAPAMNKARGFDKSCIKLPPLKVEIWNGFIFVNFDENAPPLAPRLTVLTEALKNFHLDSAEGPIPDAPTKFPWNWKVMMENNNDGYHANKLHAGPLHDIVPSQMSVFPELPSDTAGYFRFNGTRHKDASFNPVHKALLPIFPGLTDEERHRFLFGQVPPTLSLVVRPDQIAYMFLHARSANELAMTRGYLVAPGASSEPLFAERLGVDMQSARTIVAQDLHVDELIPIGLRSRFAPRGRYSWQEESQRELNRWLVQRYQKAWARMKP
jgi:phenylpropionate dioxygenase-like ring-hydroxylating dioxygenase large terminal subunit